MPSDHGSPPRTPPDFVAPNPKEATAQAEAAPQSNAEIPAEQGEVRPQSQADRIRVLDKVFKNEDFRALVASQMEELERTRDANAARSERFEAKCDELRTQREVLLVQNSTLMERLAVARGERRHSRLYSSVVGILVTAAFFAFQERSLFLGWFLGAAGLALLVVDALFGHYTAKKALRNPRPHKAIESRSSGADS